MQHLKPFGGYESSPRRIETSREGNIQQKTQHSLLGNYGNIPFKLSKNLVTNEYDIYFSRDNEKIKTGIKDESLALKFLEQWSKYTKEYSMKFGQISGNIEDAVNALKFFIVLFEKSVKGGYSL